MTYHNQFLIRNTIFLIFSFLVSSSILATILYILNISDRNFILFLCSLILSSFLTIFVLLIYIYYTHYKHNSKQNEIIDLSIKDFSKSIYKPMVFYSLKKYLFSIQNDRTFIEDSHFWGVLFELNRFQKNLENISFEHQSFLLNQMDLLFNSVHLYKKYSILINQDSVDLFQYNSLKSFNSLVESEFLNKNSNNRLDIESRFKEFVNLKIMSIYEYDFYKDFVKLGDSNIFTQLKIKLFF